MLEFGDEAGEVGEGGGGLAGAAERADLVDGAAYEGGVGGAGGCHKQAGVVGGGGGLVAMEEFFEEFFAGAEAGEGDADASGFAVFGDFQAGEADHLLGKVDDLDGFAHVEDEDAAAAGVGGGVGDAHGGGLEDEADGFADGHEVALHVGVGDG